jgi:tRNA/rRNA methyltransferase
VRSCGARFTTFERVQLREVAVVKSRAASARPFDRGKIEQSVALACRKRGIEQERIDQLVSGIQRQVETSGDAEVSLRAHRRDGDGRPAPARQRRLHPLRQRLPRLQRAKDFEEFASSVRDVGREGWRDSPVIVLVRPQLGENIGKAARAMLNFGLTEMRLVEPRDGWPNPFRRSGREPGADIVLERRGFSPPWPRRSPIAPRLCHHRAQARRVQAGADARRGRARDPSAHRGRSAVLFGPERSGLETDDVALARAIVTVPINPEFGSLNLAQAVILCAYEWSKMHELAADAGRDPAASSAGRARRPDRPFRGAARAARLFPPQAAPRPPAAPCATC